MLLVVNYHYIRHVFDSPYPAIRGVTPTELEVQLRALRRLGRMLSAGELATMVDTGTGPEEPSVLVTLDDGLAEQFAAGLPVFRRLDIRPVFFVATRPIRDKVVELVHKIHILRSHVSRAVLARDLDEYVLAHGISIDAASIEEGARHYRYDDRETARLKYLLNFGLREEEATEFVDRSLRRYLDFDESLVSERLYLSKGDIRDLYQHAEVETHGHRHVPLTSLTRKDQLAEIGESQTLLRSWGSRPLGLISYPYGSRDACSEELASAVRECKISIGFTMERAVNENLKRPLLLSRFSNSDMPMSEAELPMHVPDYWAGLHRSSWFVGSS